MKNIILNFPRQFARGIDCAKDIKIGGNFDNVIVCGVGGSALPGNLVEALEILKIPLYTHRDYNLPSYATKDSLIISVSFSGNTEETLSGYEEAVNKKYPVIALSTGGKLETLAKQHGLPVAIVPNDCLQPRFGTGYLAGAMLKILANCQIIPDQTKALITMASNLRPESQEEDGKALAKKLIDKIPIIYASNDFKLIALMWKIKFNENSKIMAFWNYFPELNHNEMVGLSTNNKKQITNNNFHFIILKDKNDNPKISKRMEITANLIKESGAGVEIIEMQGQTKIEKIFNASLLGDWASYYLALSYGIDPVPVAIVEKFKKQL